MSRVLIVDDEPSMRVTLEANLELAGLDVVSADDAEQAIGMVARQEFDLVLTDIRMPGMSGVDLFREIRKLRPHLPVVLMTAFAFESMIAEAVNEGVFTVLSKPFDVDVATAILARAARHPAVMVVDGEGKVVAEALERVGVRARAVKDEAGALAALRDDDTDVCVIDAETAGRGDPPLVDKLRVADRDLAFVAVAGDDVPELIRRVQAGGAQVRWVRRPVSATSLTTAIAETRGSSQRKR